ncbi:MAG TPA: histidine kinase, partial [Gammaproteobacteria bacterium]|jgi:two-component system sensor histidine kinase AlgZ|nr:histidine kinase [Gammaproteobacteria bacterium]
MERRVNQALLTGTPVDHAFFLPDFCSGTAILPVILIAELLAFILATAGHPLDVGFWADLGLTSLFLQWVALTSAGVLCGVRRHLSGHSTRLTVVVSYIFLLATTAFLSECAYQVSAVTGIAPGVIAESHLPFIGRNLIISAIINALVLRYFYVNRQWKKNVEREAQSRIEALQARIRPHFLFNSLNTIAALIAAQPRVAERAIEDLADLFRASLGAAGTVVSLADEVALTREYEHIEKLRLGERLRVDWRIDQLPGEARVPQLMLQPVLENAIYHGIEPLPAGGVIEVDGHRTQNDIIIRVTNPIAPLGSPRRRGNSMALDNVRERLRLLYGSAATVDADMAGERFQLTLRFPYRAAEAL